MNAKQKTAIIIAIIGIVGATAGGSMVFDFSTTITDIGQIGDINTFIENNIGINLDEFKKMCDEGLVEEEFEKYCRLV